MRTMSIAALACLALAACNDDKREGDPKRPTRIVCADATGRVVHDDFTGEDGITSYDRDSFSYVSATQEGTVRIVGQCVTYPMARPAGWRPVIRGLPG